MYLVCGEALYDVFIGPGHDESDGCLSLTTVAGGSPFNVAVGLARLKARVAFGGDIARDALGERLAARLVFEGVDDRFLRRSAQSTALAFVSVDDKGAPTYSFQGLEQAMLVPDSGLIRMCTDQIACFHFGSIGLVHRRSSEALLDLAHWLSERIFISFDPNVRLAIEPDRQRWRSAIERARPLAHLVKVSEEDIRAIYGDQIDAEILCERWLADQTILVVLTRGAEGATIFRHEAQPIRIRPRRVTVADTVGAGDSFMAGLLTALSRGGRLTAASLAAQNEPELRQAGWFAASAAALTCSRLGPVLPRIEEVERLATTTAVEGT